MKNYLTLTRQQACRFLLAHQGLRPPYEIESKAGILDFIRHVGCIQFDPLDIVGHNPELVLQSRVGDFRPAMLEELLYRDRKLLDGWDKMMAIYCREDWPYLRYRQREAAWRSPRSNTELIKTASGEIYKAIEEKGPLSSIDLEHDRKVDWAWGPTRLAKVALEDMYYRGELVIHHKVHTRRVYDLARRHIPETLLEAPDPHPTQEQYHDWHILRRIGGVGLLWNAHSIWHGIYRAGSRERAAAFTRLRQQGKAAEVGIEGIAADEERTATHTFPDDYANEKLQGRPASFGFHCKEVKSRLVPEWTDNLAQTMGDNEGLLDLRIKVRESLTESAEREAEAEYAEKVIKKLLEDASLNYPPVLLEGEQRELVDDLQRRLRTQNLDLETYLKVENKTPEELLEELEPRAKDRLERALLIGKIVDEEEVEVEDQEVEERIQSMNQALGDANLQQVLQSDASRRRIRNDLLVDKALERLVALAKGETEFADKPSKE